MFFLTDKSPQTFSTFQRDTVIRSGNTLRSDQVTPNKSNPKVYQVSTFHIPEGTWSWLGSMFGLHRLSTWCWILHSTDEMLQWTRIGPSFSSAMEPLHWSCAIIRYLHDSFWSGNWESVNSIQRAIRSFNEQEMEYGDRICSSFLLLPAWALVNIQVCRPHHSSHIELCMINYFPWISWQIHASTEQYSKCDFFPLAYILDKSQTLSVTYSEMTDHFSIIILLVQNNPHWYLHSAKKKKAVVNPQMWYNNYPS